jgi:MoaA/NifB/PqqE/SkfB family radical SAM enzyme
MAIGISGSNGGVGEKIMALGISGSNGGIKQVEANTGALNKYINKPLEVSYFVNNYCNLQCKHCYVGYENKENSMNLFEWMSLFDKFIELGAKTFGNVGKEPIMAPELTISLLNYFKAKRNKDEKIRYGLVTNGTWLQDSILDMIADAKPDYIDISLDGPKAQHNFIRGTFSSYNTTFDVVTENIETLNKKYPELSDKIFISFTLMKHNKNSLNELIKYMQNIGTNNFVISPYMQSEKDPNNDLGISVKKIAQTYKEIIEGINIDYSSIKDATIYLKSDPDAHPKLMKNLINSGALNLNKLLVDDYGVIFNLNIKENNSKVILNYLPHSEALKKAVRISHDGYMSGCLEMMHKDYPTRANSVRYSTKEEISQKFIS